MVYVCLSFCGSTKSLNSIWCFIWGSFWQLTTEHRIGVKLVRTATVRRAPLFEKIFSRTQCITITHTHRHWNWICFLLLSVGRMCAPFYDWMIWWAFTFINCRHEFAIVHVHKMKIKKVKEKKIWNFVDLWFGSRQHRGHKFKTLSNPITCLFIFNWKPFVALAFGE